MLGHLADSETRVATPHLPGPAFGRFERAGDSFRWLPGTGEP
jgi:hypothetical protein